MRISVIVPSFRRPDRLRGALEALIAQERTIDELIVARRATDAPIAEVLAAFPEVGQAVVDVPGVLAAMAAGARLASHELIGFVDDDAEPPPHWSRVVLSAFEDPTVGGFAGRDVVTDPDDLPKTSDVGRVTRWGKVIGNHHLATGPPRDVDVLKAVNMVFRREALRLPTGLRGAGAQVHFEVATCLAARAAGWRLRFDPGLEVLHLPGPRFDADTRTGPDAQAMRDAAFNLVACLLSVRPELMYRRAGYGLLVGDIGTPGLARAVVALVVGDRRVWRRVLPSVHGQIAALGAVRRGHLVLLLSFS